MQHEDSFRFAVAIDLQPEITKDLSGAIVGQFRRVDVRTRTCMIRKFYINLLWNKEYYRAKTLWSGSFFSGQRGRSAPKSGSESTRHKAYPGLSSPVETKTLQIGCKYGLSGTPGESLLCLRRTRGPRNHPLGLIQKRFRIFCI